VASFQPFWNGVERLERFRDKPRARLCFWLMRKWNDCPRCPSLGGTLGEPFVPPLSPRGSEWNGCIGWPSRVGDD
jgi:hypothetical protein